MTSNSIPTFISPLHHDEFLPRISPWMILAGSFLASTVVIAFAICTFTPLPVTVKGQGLVRPIGEIKIIQSASEGTVKMILVKENETVKRGETIAILDSAKLVEKKAQLQSNIVQNTLQSAQISAQIENLKHQKTAELERVNFTVAVAQAELKKIDREYQEKTQTTAYQSSEAKANLQVNQKELSKILTDEQSAQASVRGSRLALEIAQNRLTRYQAIADEGALGQDKLDEAQLQVSQAQQTLEERQANFEAAQKNLEKQQNAIEAAQFRLNQTLASLNPSNAVITMAKEKISQEKASGEASISRLKQERQGLYQRKTELKKQIESDRSEIAQVKLEMAKTLITTPNEGVILKLNLRNLNQSIRNGDEIAQVSPINAPLVIKVKVATQDRGKLKLNQLSQMKVAAYSYPDYGLLNGKVISISPDVIIPQQNAATQGQNQTAQQSPYYEVTIKPDVLYLKNNPENVIKPGMEITADIVSKQETVLQFVLRKARLFVDK